MAELDIQTKLSFSHRGRAFQALLERSLYRPIYDKFAQSYR